MHLQGMIKTVDLGKVDVNIEHGNRDGVYVDGLDGAGETILLIFCI